MGENQHPNRPVTRTRNTASHYKPRQKKSKKKSSAARWSTGRVIGTILLILLLTGIMTGATLLFMIVHYMDDSMRVTLDSLNLNQSSIMYYQDQQSGEWIEQEKLHGSSDRQWVSLDQIPENMRNAAIAIEDKRFRSHNGVDWLRTASAVKNLFTGGQQFGGSTITQQLVKNVTQDDDVSIKRKLQEIIRALELDAEYSKDQILEYYLNTIYLGQNCYGVQAAAKTYFNKDVSQLSLAEGAAIVGITKYPGLYDPFVHPEENKQRQETILKAMLEQGMISEEEKEAADAETLLFQKETAQAASQSKQSYYVDQVISDVIDDLMEQYGYKYQVAEQLIYGGGLRIYTAMNKDVQDAMDSVFVDNPDFPKVRGTKQPEAAMTVIDPYTGAIVGIIGGVGEKTANRTLNRASSSTRSPGSSIKPLSVYAPAIEKNLITVGSVFDDSPVDIASRYPKNYDNKYRGLMTVTEAVQISTNPTPTRILGLLGFEESYQFLTENLGLTTVVDRMVTSNGKVRTDLGYGPLAMGGMTKGVTVTELTAAYVPFANKGVYYAPFTYYRVEDASGHVLLENHPEGREAMSEQTAYIMNNLLQNVVNNGTGRAAKISGQPTAGKTGTTSDDYDRWFVGYTPYYVGAVWYGFDTNKTIVTVSGTNPALSIWKQVMAKVHEGKERADFYTVDGVVTAEYCTDSGLAPTDLCRSDPRGSRVATGVFKAGTQPTEKCNVHVEATICTDSNQIAGPYCPSDHTRTVGLLNFKREFPYQITITDAQYTYLPLLTGSCATGDVPVYQSLLGEGMYAGTSGVERPMNHICSVHTETVVPDEPPADPNMPDTPVEPGGATEPNTGTGETGGGTGSTGAGNTGTGNSGSGNTGSGNSGAGSEPGGKPGGPSYLPGSFG